MRGSGLSIWTMPSSGTPGRLWSGESRRRTGSLSFPLDETLQTTSAISRRPGLPVSTKPPSLGRLWSGESRRRVGSESGSPDGVTYHILGGAGSAEAERAQTTATRAKMARCMVKVCMEEIVGESVLLLLECLEMMEEEKMACSKSDYRGPPLYTMPCGYAREVTRGYTRGYRCLRRHTTCGAGGSSV